ncbi:putative transcription factor NAM family [Dioscorea sansibarensis]
MRLPRGCRFVPTELELIQYLSDKVEGRADPGQGLIVDDVDVYATSPHLLSAASSIANGRDGKLFHFTPIKFRKASARCRDRSTPSGFWKAINGRSEVHDEVGKGVGFMQNFIYFHGRSGGARTKWMMKEYTLSAKDSSNVALCVIHSTPDKFNKPDQTRNALLMSLRSQSPLSNNAFRGSPSPYGMRTDCASDGGECSGSVSVVGSGHGMDGLSWEPGSGLLESILYNNKNSVSAIPSGSGLPESSNNEDSLSERPWSVSGLLKSFNYEESLLATPQPGSGLLESFNDEDSQLPGSGLLEFFLSQDEHLV